ncbi:MAG TPA: DUF4279 domain-containing protein [Blastocatellia bacterium]|nr:DUF4279 domain-containing protein [Blastocatellia bacterium]
MTLRILKDGLDVENVTTRLGISPSEHSSKSKSFSDEKRPKTGVWFLSSKGIVPSKDSARHLEWLLDQLMPKQKALEDLRADGFLMDVSCYWLSAYGQGGPTLSPALMGNLGKLGLELWFDVYLG